MYVARRDVVEKLMYVPLLDRRYQPSAECLSQLKSDVPSPLFSNPSVLYTDLGQHSTRLSLPSTDPSDSTSHNGKSRTLIEGQPQLVDPRPHHTLPILHILGISIVTLLCVRLFKYKCTTTLGLFRQVFHGRNKPSVFSPQCMIALCAHPTLRIQHGENP